MRTRRIGPLLATAAMLIAACASGQQVGRSAPHPTAAPAPRLASVFVAALGNHPRPPDGGSTLVVDHTVCSRALGVPPCPPTPIPADVQAEIRAALGPDVRFVPEPPSAVASGKRLVITLGPPHIDGDRATISVEILCGPLCGEGSTLVLHRLGDTWVRTGTEGRSWIS